MVGKYKVVTLCGSTRFKDEFYKVQKELTLKGYIVISVGLYGHSGDTEVWENMDEGTLTKTKEMLDDMHKRKMIGAVVYLIAQCMYFGVDAYKALEVITAGQAQTANYLTLFISIIAVIIPILAIMDIGLSSGKKVNYLEQDKVTI